MCWATVNQEEDSRCNCGGRESGANGSRSLATDQTKSELNASFCRTRSHSPSFIQFGGADHLFEFLQAGIIHEFSATDFVQETDDFMKSNDLLPVRVITVSSVSTPPSPPSSRFAAAVFFPTAGRISRSPDFAVSEASVNR